MKNDKDSLGDRMKGYENLSNLYFDKSKYVVLRIDQKAGHTFTRQMPKPFYSKYVAMMNIATKSLAKEMQGCLLAYTQSDEASFILYAGQTPETQAWFDNNLQKIVSVSASIFTAYFNNCWNEYSRTSLSQEYAFFDSRAFSLDTDVEVVNYLRWRIQDCERNALSAVAQSLYSPKELHKQDSRAKAQLLLAKGIDWNTYDPALKYGRFAEKVSRQVATPYALDGLCMRNAWEIRPAFAPDNEQLKKLITK